MSNSLTNAEIRTFKKTIELAAQQKQSKLRSAVRNEMLDSDDHYITYLSTITPHQVSASNADTVNDDVTATVRKISLQRWVTAPLMDSFDAFKMIKDPNSELVKSVVNAMNRRADQLIIDAFDGIAYEGKGGTTAKTFDTDMQVAVGTSGLTVAKIRNALYLLEQEEVWSDEDEFYIVASPRQKYDLLGSTEVTSVDYNGVRTLVNGEVDSFLGFKFIWTNRLANYTANQRACFAFAKSGVAFGIGKDYMNVRVEERADKNYSTQIFTEGFIGSARLDEKKVVRILCSEA